MGSEIHSRLGSTQIGLNSVEFGSVFIYTYNDILNIC